MPCHPVSCACVTVRYGLPGERHGTPAERLLAAQMRAKQALQSRPHTLFATGPKQQPQTGGQVGVVLSGCQAALGWAGRLSVEIFSI